MHGISPSWSVQSRSPDSVVEWWLKDSTDALVKYSGAYGVVTDNGQSWRLKAKTVIALQLLETAHKPILGNRHGELGPLGQAAKCRHPLCIFGDTEASQP
jgi:hypothetical protein